MQFALDPPLASAERERLGALLDIAWRRLEALSERGESTPNHCYWAVAPSGDIEVLEGDELSLDDGARLWERKRVERVIVIKMWTGCLDGDIDEFAYLHTAPFFLYAEGGVLAGETLGPVYGDDEMQAFLNCVENLAGDAHELFEQLASGDERVAAALPPWRTLQWLAD